MILSIFQLCDVPLSDQDASGPGNPLALFRLVPSSTAQRILLLSCLPPRVVADDWDTVFLVKGNSGLARATILFPAQVAPFSGRRPPSQRPARHRPPIPTVGGRSASCATQLRPHFILGSAIFLTEKRMSDRFFKTVENSSISPSA